MSHSCDGILLVDKEEGETSFSVVKKVRKAFAVGKAGHAGTLDPFATGLLVVLLGQATKLFPFVVGGEKEYRATLRLGIETDTMDHTGRVVKTSPVPDLGLRVIQACARTFTGEIEQLPPSFSALKRQGKRCYELARKGIRVDLEKRKVRIHRLEVESVQLPDVTLVVVCSSGTYIRSLAADLGIKLGPGAHLKALRRLSSGPFRIEQALRSGELEERSTAESLRDRVIPLKEALPGMKEMKVDGAMASRIRQGYQPGLEDLGSGRFRLPAGESLVRLVRDKDLIGIMNVDRPAGTEAARMRIVRVFQEEEQTTD